MLTAFDAGDHAACVPSFSTLRINCRWECESASRRRQVEWEELEEFCESRGLKLERVFGQDIG